VASDVSQLLTLYITLVVYLYLETFKDWVRGDQTRPALPVIECERVEELKVVGSAVKG
jgi:hypothetical protein